MKMLVKCNGYIGDHLFATGIAQSSQYTDPIDYCVQVVQVMDLFNNDPRIGNVMHISELTDEMESQYDVVYSLPKVDQSFPPPLYFKHFCEIMTNDNGYKIYTSKGLDDSVRIQLPINGKPNVAIQANWDERSFLFTKEQYAEGINHPPDLGYGGARRDIDKITKGIAPDVNFISVGYPSGTPSDMRQPAGGIMSSGIYSTTASIIKACDYMIGGESGLINLAAGVGTKTIITGDFVHQLYGPNGVIKKIQEPKLGPEFYFPDGEHVSLDPFLTDDEVIEQMREIICT
jgi:hypothetical protein